MPNITEKESKTKTKVFTVDNFNSTTNLADAIFTPPLGSTNSINEKDDLYDPFEERNHPHPNTDMGALAHLLKSSLGTGILAMPMAFRNAGLAFGFVMTLVVGFVCTHCVQILVQSSHELCKRSKTPSLDFSRTAGAAFEYGPKKVRFLAGFARIFVNVALVVTYFSGNCVYVVFISESIMRIVEQYTDEGVLKSWVYMVALLIFLIPISEIRRLKYLVPFSLMANVFIVVSLGITLYYMFIGLKPLSEVEMFSSFGQLPMFFSTVIFAMEGIGVIMPIENSMVNPGHFLGCPGVLNTAMIVVVSLYTLMGFFGYLRFGEETKGSVTLNLPIDEIPAQIVQLLIAMAILFTYGLQFFVPMEITWKGMKPSISEKWRNLVQVLLRAFIVCGTVLVAVLVNNLESLIGLVGSVCFSILGLMVPAIVETVTRWEDGLGRFNWRLIKNILLIIFALFALVSGSISSIKNIIDPPTA